MKMRALFCSMMLACSVVACSTDENYAPVMDVATIEHVPKSGVYRVSANETLYSIAWRYGLDYRYLANLNHIGPPYHVVAGQRLYLTGKPVRTRNTTTMQPMREAQQQPKMFAYHPLPSVKSVHAMPERARPAAPLFVEHESNASVKTWHWPARGPVIGTYSTLNKGINIGGHLGDPVYATAAGLIVYSGNRLRGYGNLIIIKHNSTYLTAYAHTSAVLVKNGEWVGAGQKIAEMGSTGAQRVMLHFEIRRSGQPVNPLNYLAR